VDAETAGEVALAVATTLDAPPSSHDHLCCGGMGRAEVLLVVGQARADEALVWEAQRRAALLAARVLEAGRAGLRVAGFESGAFRPGFFRGWSGIGYQLLRTAAPARLPSVLAFEAGTRRA
jgi:lantibiotic modifying enzyme